MPTAPIDIELPETFHRNKRMVLIFCSAALVISLAQVGRDQALNMPYVSVSIDKVQIWLLLWASAAYYGAGFAIDAVLAWNRSTEFAVRSRAAAEDSVIAVQATLKAAARELQGTLGTLTEASKVLGDIPQEVFNTFGARLVEQGPQRLKADLEALPETPDEEGILRPNQPGPNLVTRLMARHRENIWQAVDVEAHALRKSMKELTKALERTHQPIEKSLQQQAELQAYLSDLKPRLSRLAPAIGTIRKGRFYFWEVGAPAALFAATTLMGAPEFVAAASRILDTPAVARSFVDDLGCAWRGNTVAGCVRETPAA